MFFDQFGNKYFYHKNWFFRNTNLKGLFFVQKPKNNQKLDIYGNKTQRDSFSKPTMLRFSTFFRNDHKLGRVKRYMDFHFLKSHIHRKNNFHLRFGEINKYFKSKEVFAKELEQIFIELFQNIKRKIFIKNSKTYQINKNTLNQKKIIEKKNIIYYMEKILMFKEIYSKNNKFFKNKNITEQISDQNLFYPDTNVTVVYKNFIESPVKINCNNRIRLLDFYLKKKKYRLPIRQRYEFFKKKTKFKYEIFKKNENLFIIEDYFCENFDKTNLKLLFKNSMKYIDNDVKKNKNHGYIFKKKMKYLVILKKSSHVFAIDVDLSFSFFISMNTNGFLSTSKFSGVLLSKKILDNTTLDKKNLKKKVNSRVFLINLLSIIKSLSIYEGEKLENLNEDISVPFLEFLVKKIHFKKTGTYFTKIDFLDRKNKNDIMIKKNKIITIKKINEEFLDVSMSDLFKKSIERDLQWNDQMKNCAHVTSDNFILKKKKKKFNFKEILETSANKRKAFILLNEKKIIDFRKNVLFLCIDNCAKFNFKKKHYIELLNSQRPLLFSNERCDKVEDNVRNLCFLKKFSEDFAGIDLKFDNEKNIGHIPSTIIAMLLCILSNKNEFKKGMSFNKNFYLIKKIVYSMKREKNPSLVLASWPNFANQMITRKIKKTCENFDYKIENYLSQIIPIKKIKFLNKELNPELLEIKTKTITMNCFKKVIDLKKYIETVDKMERIRNRCKIFDFLQLHKKKSFFLKKKKNLHEYYQVLQFFLMQFTDFRLYFSVTVLVNLKIKQFTNSISKRTFFCEHSI
jgi:hypothetical protein